MPPFQKPTARDLAVKVYRLELENIRLRKSLQLITDISLEAIGGQNPWHVVGQMGGIAESTLWPQWCRCGDELDPIMRSDNDPAVCINCAAGYG